MASPPDGQAGRDALTPVPLAIADAEVLVELGELVEAELIISDAVADTPDEPGVLSLLAKIKHMKGELSLAIACWAQLEAEGTSEPVRRHLHALLGLARDPERGAGEFLALGPGRITRRPAAHFELERALRLFLAGRRDEARAQCEEVAIAHAYAHGDLAIHKLGMIASAWIAEISGDLEGACATLESLARARGFETDTDRILALVRIYDAIGTRPRLQQAVNICRFLERHHGSPSITCHQAALHRRLGDTTAAQQYELQAVAAFRRLMHRPSGAAVIRTAARRFFPLERLRRIAGSGHGVDARSASGRERALAAALDGASDHAQMRFERLGKPIDMKYLGELAAERGAHDEAARHWCRALEREREMDPRVLLRLFDREPGQVEPAAEVLLRSVPRAHAVKRTLEGAIRRDPLRPEPWRALATVLSLQGIELAADRCARRALVLLHADERARNPIGRVLSAAVYHFAGATRGLIHEVWVDREPAGGDAGGTLPEDRVRGNLTPEMRAAVRDTFLAVRAYARRKLPHLTDDLADHVYSYRVTKEDEPSGGLSAGLPTALAFLSAFIQRPVPGDIAASGTLFADAHDVLVVKRVGDPAIKARGAYNRNLRMLILPTENREEVWSSPLIPLSISDTLVRHASSLDDAVRMVFGDDIFAAP